MVQALDFVCVLALVLLGVHDVCINSACHIAEIADPLIGSFVCLRFRSHMFCLSGSSLAFQFRNLLSDGCCRYGFSGSSLAFQFSAFLFNLCHGVVNGLCVQTRNVWLCFLCLVNTLRDVVQFFVCQVLLLCSNGSVFVHGIIIFCLARLAEHFRKFSQQIALALNNLIKIRIPAHL